MCLLCSKYFWLAVNQQPHLPSLLMFQDLIVKLDNFFGLTLSLWCTTWLNSVAVVEKWHHSLLWVVFTMIFSLPPGRGFHKKLKISEALCTLCPISPVYAALLSDRWRRNKLISSPRSNLPQQTTECLQTTPSVGSSSSWDGPVYSTATLPATIWSQFKLDLKERVTTNRIKREPPQTAAADFNIHVQTPFTF